MKALQSKLKILKVIADGYNILKGAVICTDLIVESGGVKCRCEEVCDDHNVPSGLLSYAYMMPITTLGPASKEEQLIFAERYLKWRKGKLNEEQASYNEYKRELSAVLQGDDFISNLADKLLSGVKDNNIGEILKGLR